MHYRAALLVEAAGVPEGKHPIAQLRRVGAIHFRKWISPLFGDPDHRRVLVRHQTQRFRLQTGAVFEDDRDLLLHSGGDVGGGQHQPIRGNDHAASRSVREFDADRGRPRFGQRIAHGFLERFQINPGFRSFLFVDREPAVLAECAEGEEREN